MKVAGGMFGNYGLPNATGNGLGALSWDGGLACLAQAWANQCKFSHDEQRKTTKFPMVGQNAFYSSGKRGDWGSIATNAWFAGELPEWKMYQGNVSHFGDYAKKPFDASSTYTEFWQAVGHMTQMIWGKTKSVGCGMASDHSGTYIYCNYGPGGNMPNATVYPTE